MRNEPDGRTVDRLVDAVLASRCGVLVAGWGADVDPATAAAFAAATGWPVLADPLSGLRAGDNAVSTYDALLRVPAFAARIFPTSSCASARR